MGIALAVLGCSFHARAAFDPIDGGDPNSYACMCTCIEGQNTQTLSVASGSDDAEEDVSSSVMNLTDPVLHITRNGLNFVGIRFTDVRVPPGATVESAVIQFTAAASNSNTTGVELLAEASDDAATFGTDDGNLSVRPETSLANDVEWSVGPWVAGEAGPEEQTPDLSGFLNEVVTRPGWMAGNAVMIIFRGDGEHGAFSFEGDPTKAPRLIVTYSVPGSSSATLQTCMPDDLNPGLNGGTAPTADQLAADCSGRVAQTLGGLNRACGYPSSCSCTFVPDAGTKLAESCSSSCAAVPLASDCSNYDPTANMTTATNANGDAPVCVAHSPITAEMFGQKSLCDTEGTVTFHTDDETKNSHAHGLVEFSGRPCPGASCSVGMTYAFDANPITFGNFFGSATFRNLAAVGESAPGSGALLASDGTGAIPGGGTDSTARGTRDGNQLALESTNGDPVAVSIVWGGDAPSCSLSGTLAGSVDPELKRCENAGPTANQICTQDADCTDDPDCSDGVCNCIKVGATDTNLSANLAGPLLNQPPQVSAGADQVVECNLPGGATFRLSASGTDFDGNAHLYTWFRGVRPGEAVGFLPSIQMQQAVGTRQPYFVRLIDDFAQADESTTHVEVEDTTPPVISCNAPSSIDPTSPPLAFTASASDVCDPSVVPTLTEFTCYRVNGAGKVVDKTHACAAKLDGATIHIAHGNGVGEHIRWRAQATDGSGNSSTAICETVIDRK